jgi:hypothetical protein
MQAWSLAALIALPAAAGQTRPAPDPSILLSYRAATEDEGVSGRATLTLHAGEVTRAAVWELGCRLGVRTDAGAPSSDVDQYWSVQAELTKASAGPVVRIRYRVVKPPAAGSQKEHLLRLDGRNPLHLEELSARTDCRYDRIYLTLSAR